jgi:hypothetical protein
MDKTEARAVLTRYFADWRKRSYQELITSLGNQGCDVVIGPSGTEYQIEVDVMWDGKAGSDVLVLGSIDDGHFLAALSPLSDSFIKAPDGSFVGEDPPNGAAPADAAKKPPRV